MGLTFDMLDMTQRPPTSTKPHHLPQPLTSISPTMPLPVEDQFPEADASASAQASSSSTAKPTRPKISDPKHLSSLLDMLADGEGDDDEGTGGAAPGPGGIQVEEIESEDED